MKLWIKSSGGKEQNSTGINSVKMNPKYLLAILVLAVIVVAGVVYYWEDIRKNPPPAQPTILAPQTAENSEPATSSAETPIETTDKSSTSVNEEVYPPPIRDAEGRITKKPFGIKISPATSPVQPEKFSGYHTGTDFEAREGEFDQEVVVHPICVGEVKEVKRVSGYGGVVIQVCEINNESVSVIYGHISLSKSPISPGARLTLMDPIAILADDKSSESDGERKHLHLGIYKGGQVDLRGYVSTEAELEKWINPESVLSLK